MCIVKFVTYSVKTQILRKLRQFLANAKNKESAKKHSLIVFTV